MAVTQLVLTGVPAFVGSVTGQTNVKFFIDENEFNPNNSIEVDLAKNTTLPPASWATAVDVDLQTTGGYTTIGPRFHAGPHVGGVYLAQRLVTKYASVLASWPPAPDAIYQYQAVLRADNGGNITRYHGFKVQVMSPIAGTLAQLAFIPPGSAAPQPAGPVRWIDLADAAVSDPRANGFTAIDVTTQVGAVGALFLTSIAMGAQGFAVPKYPKGFGW